MNSEENKAEEIKEETEIPEETTEASDTFKVPSDVPVSENGFWIPMV